MRMGKIVAVSLLCLALAAGAACGGGGAEPTATPAGEAIHVGPADSGRELTLDVGDWLVATMECDVSAGYHWYLINVTNRSVLGHVSEEYIPWWETGADDRLSRRIWTFEAKTAGTSDIYMTYNRSPELDPVPADTFNLSVTVR